MRSNFDSLDFLAVVVRVSERTARRIEEDDYDQLADLDGWVRLLTTPEPRRRASDHVSARGRRFTMPPIKKKTIRLGRRQSVWRRHAGCLRTWFTITSRNWLGSALPRPCPPSSQINSLYGADSLL
jgi:hypothetical protein